MAFSPDNKLLACGYEIGECKLFSTTDPKYSFIATLQAHTDWVNSVTFSSDSAILVSGSADKTICVWSTLVEKNYALLLTLKGHSNWVFCVSLMPMREVDSSSSSSEKK